MHQLPILIISADANALFRHGIFCLTCLKHSFLNIKPCFVKKYVQSKVNVKNQNWDTTLWDLFKNKEGKRLAAKKDREGPVGLLNPILSSSATKSCRVSWIQQDFSITLFLSPYQHRLPWHSNSKHPPPSLLFSPLSQRRQGGWVLYYSPSDYYCFYDQSYKSWCSLKS